MGKNSTFQMEKYQAMKNGALNLSLYPLVQVECTSFDETFSQKRKRERQMKNTDQLENLTGDEGERKREERERRREEKERSRLWKLGFPFDWILVPSIFVRGGRRRGERKKAQSGKKSSTQREKGGKNSNFNTKRSTSILCCKESLQVNTDIFDGLQFPSSPSQLKQQEQHQEEKRKRPG